jgi:dephospho-CoA kinase
MDRLGSKVEDKGLKIIGFVGLPGSGKSVASDVARKMGLIVLVMGDIIRHEASRLGLEPTDENLGVVGNMLRAGEGPQAVAQRILEEARRTGEDTIIVDGLRSKIEVDFFRANSEEFRLVEIRAPSDARIRWIATRGRSDDPIGGGSEAGSGKDLAASGTLTGQQTAKALEKRDSREHGWGIGDAIKEADIKIDNDGDLQDFRRRVQMLLGELASGGTKNSR